MFNVAAFCNSIIIKDENHNYEEHLQAIRDAYAVQQLIYSNGYVCRALFWGMATALENQLTYLGGTILPNLERRLNNLLGRGVLSESDLDTHMFANEDKPHVQEDATVEDQRAELEARIDQIKETMLEVGVGFVEAVRNHDELSHDLNLLTFSAIKAKAAERRRVATAA